MNAAPDPRHLSKALSELIALKGYARVGGESQLAGAWSEISGPRISGRTKVLGIKRGVLQIAVVSSPLLSELESFHKHSLLESLQEKYADLGIRDLRFRLRGDLQPG